MEVSRLANPNVKKEIKEIRKQSTWATFMKQMGKKLDLSVDGTMASWATILSALKRNWLAYTLHVAAQRWNVRLNSERKK